MIIFWKFLFSEDLQLYERDPSNPVNNASEIAPYEVTNEDKAVNYSIGIFFIFPWIFSTFLNPLLYWHFRKVGTKASHLFKVLAMTDFLTNMWAPLAYTYFMLTPEVLPSTYIGLRPTRAWTCLFGCFSQIVSFLLAVSRAIKIVSPFYSFKHRYLQLYLGVYFVYMILNNGAFFVISQFNTSWKMLGMKIGLNLCLWANFAHCLGGVSVSLFSVFYLYITTRFEPLREVQCILYKQFITFIY